MFESRDSSNRVVFTSAQSAGMGWEGRWSLTARDMRNMVDGELGPRDSQGGSGTIERMFAAAATAPRGGQEQESSSGLDDAVFTEQSKYAPTLRNG